MTIEEKQRIVYRDSINGQFITRREEEKRPSTTKRKDRNCGHQHQNRSLQQARRESKHEQKNYHRTECV